MGNPLIWLSGAQRKVLADCPTERPKYLGLGSAILFTAAVAGVSMTFALRIALNTPLSLAIPFAVAWSLGIMSLDRWLVVSLHRDKNWRRYLLLVLPRVFLALLFGVIISTPVVLQVFRPEINAEIPLVERQNAAVYYHRAAGDPIARQVVRERGLIKALQAKASNGGISPPNFATNPDLKALRRARNRATINAGRTRHQWLFGPVAGRPSAEQAYKRWIRLQQKDIAQINALEKKLQKKYVAARNGAIAYVNNQIIVEQGRLKIDLNKEGALLAQLKAQTKAEDVSGLFIRLQALDDLADLSTTIWWARTILALLFITIECLPVGVKTLLNFGPESAYDSELAKEQAMQASAAEHRRELRKRRKFAESEWIASETDRAIAAAYVAAPDRDEETAHTVERVSRAWLRDWEFREMQDISWNGQEHQPARSARGWTGRMHDWTATMASRSWTARRSRWNSDGVGFHGAPFSPNGSSGRGS